MLIMAMSDTTYQPVEPVQQGRNAPLPNGHPIASGCPNPCHYPQPVCGRRTDAGDDKLIEHELQAPCDLLVLPARTDGHATPEIRARQLSLLQALRCAMETLDDDERDRAVIRVRNHLIYAAEIAALYGYLSESRRPPPSLSSPSA